VRVSSPPSSSSSVSPTVISPTNGHANTPPFLTPVTRSSNTISPEDKHVASSLAHRQSISSLDDRQSSANLPLHLGFKRKSNDELRDFSLKHRHMRPPNIQIKELGSDLICNQLADVPMSAPPHQSKDAMTRQWLDLRTPVEPAPLSAPPIHDQTRRFSYPTLSNEAEPRRSYVNVPGNEPAPRKHKKNSSLGSDSFDDSGSKNSPSSSVESLSDPQLQYPMCYKKGSVIQLSDGSLRKVEDMKTQDFISSASSAANLRVDTSIVAKIEDKGQNSALVTFSVGSKKATFTVETPGEHPFFVYDHGWSSCNPNRSLSRYGLQCHKLSEGDKCISLVKLPKEKLVSNKSSTTTHVTKADISHVEEPLHQQTTSAANKHIDKQPINLMKDKNIAIDKNVNEPSHTAKL